MASVVLWVAVATLFLGCRDRRDSEAPALSPLTWLAGGDVAGFTRAEGPHTFSFPTDHGPHPSFRSEWWYFTGVLEAAPAGAVASTARERARFGYQLTFFRQALAPDVPLRASRFRTRDVYMAHLAVSRLGDASSPFVAEERFARDGGGLAGATAAPFAVWTDAWRVASELGASDASAPRVGVGVGVGVGVTVANQAPDVFPLHLEAQGREVALDLHLEEGRPVLQGDAGLSRKGPAPGQASYYVSWTRLATRGQVRDTRGNALVTGTTWLDREWSTAPLPPSLQGWDWLGLRLSDGRDLMIFGLRGANGAPTAESQATLIEANGATHTYGPPEFRFTPAGTWRSPRTGVRYPASFVVELPAAALRLEIAPYRPDQELALSVRYWEGAVRARGRAADHALEGEGYLELTGY